MAHLLWRYTTFFHKKFLNPLQMWILNLIDKVVLIMNAFGEGRAGTGQLRKNHIICLKYGRNSLRVI